MGEGTDQLRHDIEGTRADLARDVDALASKVSPGRVVGDRMRRVKEGVSRVSDRVMGKAHDVHHSVSDHASSASGGVSERVSGMGEKVSGTASGVSEKVSGTAASAAEAARRAPAQVRERAEGNPLLAGAVAFGVGWLVSALVPATETEARAAARAKDAVKDHSGPVVERAREAASGVAADLREPARTAADTVASRAREGVQSVKDQGTSSAQSVRERASTSS